MCVVSMIGDHYNEKWEPLTWSPKTTWTFTTTGPTQQEFDDLKKEVLEMKELLKKAKIYDEENGEPDCEVEEKFDLIRKIAKLVDVDLEDVLKT